MAAIVIITRMRVQLCFLSCASMARRAALISYSFSASIMRLSASEAKKKGVLPRLLDSSGAFSFCWCRKCAQKNLSLSEGGCLGLS